MQKKKLYLTAIVLLLFIFVAVIFLKTIDNSTPEKTIPHPLAQINLYGERHGTKSLLKREFEIWHEHYHRDNMRHLFLELPYYTAEFLNIWMHEDKNKILDAIYNDTKGTIAYIPAMKKFYKAIKSKCPKTIFHGTDIGHQYDTTGKRFLEYLKQNKLEHTKKYALAQEAIEQGQYFYKNSDYPYRENKMTENFIREFDLLVDEKIMGIYGATHIGLDSLDVTGNVPSMANQLQKHYGDIIYSEDLSRFIW